MSNYSFATSLPPYQEAPDVKRRQADEIYNLIVRGANCLLQISEITHLPQSTVAGRINDLKKAERVEYEGIIIYKDRKRKRIVPVRVQAEMF